MLGSDPEGANTFADAWQATGGGEGADHCLALAKLQLGDVETGAEMLEKLAASSKAPAAARATVYGQADQAWLMTGDADHALADATLALSLSPDDPDLLIDRSVASATLGHFDDAVDDLSHALELDGKRPDALVLRAAAWRHEGHLDLAQDDVDRAISQDPDNPEGLSGARHPAPTSWRPGGRPSRLAACGDPGPRFGDERFGRTEPGATRSRPRAKVIVSGSRRVRSPLVRRPGGGRCGAATRGTGRGRPSPCAHAPACSAEFATRRPACGRR